VDSSLPIQPLFFVPDDPGCAVFGASQAMHRVMGLIHRAASRRCGVLLHGEPGTGRARLARAIHSTSAPHTPFESVDCAGVSPDDLELTLFGVIARPRPHGDPERRAVDRITRSGAVYKAHGGTLFLRDIAEMPARVQARLSRLLRDKEVGIADERTSASVDIRPIASIGPTPDALIAEGRLLIDFLDRLSAMRIHVPPLRQRREDVPLLVTHFLKEIARQTGTPPREVRRPALALLTALPWPGNVRELRGLLERLVLAGPEPIIRVEDVLVHIDLGRCLTLSGAPATLRNARAQFERDYIGAVLQQFHWRMDEAARVLGMQRTNLYRKARQLDLVQPPLRSAQT
jgi:two-component system nitrogen regulation response regulator NtrX